MTYYLVIDGRMASMNEYIDACRRNRYKANKMKSEAQNLCQWSIHSQLKNVRITKPVFIHFRWYEVNRRRDKDNVSSFGQKVIQDALVKCRVLQNDGWNDIVGFSHQFDIDRKRPRIEIEIQEMGGDGRER